MQKQQQQEQQKVTGHELVKAKPTAEEIQVRSAYRHGEGALGPLRNILKVDMKEDPHAFHFEAGQCHVCVDCTSSSSSSSSSSSKCLILWRHALNYLPQSSRG
jgi:hypothetical protein